MREEEEGAAAGAKAWVASAAWRMRWAEAEPLREKERAVPSVAEAGRASPMSISPSQM